MIRHLNVGDTGCAPGAWCCGTPWFSPATPSWYAPRCTLIYERVTCQRCIQYLDLLLIAGLATVVDQRVGKRRARSEVRVDERAFPNTHPCKHDMIVTPVTYNLYRGEPPEIFETTTVDELRCRKCSMTQDAVTRERAQASRQHAIEARAAREALAAAADHPEGIVDLDTGQRVTHTGWGIDWGNAVIDESAPLTPALLDAAARSMRATALPAISFRPFGVNPSGLFPRLSAGSSPAASRQTAHHRTFPEQAFFDAMGVDLDTWQLRLLQGVWARFTDRPHVERPLTATEVIARQRESLDILEAQSMLLASGVPPVAVGRMLPVGPIAPATPLGVGGFTHDAVARMPLGGPELARLVEADVAAHRRQGRIPHVVTASPGVMGTVFGPASQAPNPPGFSFMGIRVLIDDSLSSTDFRIYNHGEPQPNQCGRPGCTRIAAENGEVCRQHLQMWPEDPQV